MTDQRVRELMIPLAEYAVVKDTATLGQAVTALDEAQKSVQDRQPHRAVLVVNSRGDVVGKIGHWALLRALEPDLHGDIDKAALHRAGVSDQYISTMVAHSKLFQDNLDDLCSRAVGLPVRQVMTPVDDSIREEATLGEAMHKMIVAQTLSLLVTSGGTASGVLRLSDLVDAALTSMRRSFDRKHQE